MGQLYHKKSGMARRLKRQGRKQKAGAPNKFFLVEKRRPDIHLQSKSKELWIAVDHLFEFVGRKLAPPDLRTSGSQRRPAPQIFRHPFGLIHEPQDARKIERNIWGQPPKTIRPTPIWPCSNGGARFNAIGHHLDSSLSAHFSDEMPTGTAPNPFVMEVKRRRPSFAHKMAKDPLFDSINN